MNTTHSNRHKAKTDKQDEFYTQLSDIEKEIMQCKEQFKNKVVYCNCDDPGVSNFFHFFSYNFKQLGLKKLITTCYKNQDRDLFSQNNSERAIYLEYNGTTQDGDIPTPDDTGVKQLKGDGDFRSKECIELLKQADIVVTNPPFSLFREYVEQLITYDKKFLIIGNQNALTYKEIFKYIKANQIWLGLSMNGSNRWFGVPDYYKFNTNAKHKTENGRHLIFVNGVRWFTNLDYKERHEDLTLYKHYTPDEYPKYDNYDAINVDKTKDIPMDYDGHIGVPITFLDKYNPEQFEIIALGIISSIDFTSNKKMEILDNKGKPTGKYTNNAKGTLYRVYNPKTDKYPPAFRDDKTNELYVSIYARIIIRNKRLG